MIRMKGAQRANTCSWVEETKEVELLKIPHIEVRIEDLASLLLNHFIDGSN